ncbi:hypothetical protein DL546_007954 [Coniochaeta pulveracea]|uniref:Uncharacterized protein n=1 Tax=Coniochaeta pulveracea TaxID=177199 RepID=A0A420YFH3_9PEZI|nr:hypothetical protein DL546_007954 [Coniochaeta pulveracea]
MMESRPPGSVCWAIGRNTSHSQPTEVDLWAPQRNRYAPERGHYWGIKHARSRIYASDRAFDKQTRLLMAPKVVRPLSNDMELDTVPIQQKGSGHTIFPVINSLCYMVLRTYVVE